MNRMKKAVSAMATVLCSLAVLLCCGAALTACVSEHFESVIQHLNQKELVFSVKQGSKVVGTGATASIVANSDAEWCRATLDGNRITVRVDANEQYLSRTATLSFVDISKDLETTMKVKQNGYMRDSDGAVSVYAVVQDASLTLFRDSVLMYYEQSSATGATAYQYYTADYSYAAADAARLQQLTIPSKMIYGHGYELAVTAIGAHAFKNCTRLSDVTIPAAVTAIGAEAFSDCAQLTTVRSLIRTPFDISVDAAGHPLHVFARTDATLYVPRGTKALYEATAGWNSFSQIVEMNE